MQMTTLSFEKFKVKGANMGEASCLPDIKNDDYLRATLNIDESVPEEDRKYIKKGGINSLIPYHIQNGYDRARVDLEFDAAILENEYLKATFVTELGGKLWSLYDKKADREILYANDVFQPCNLALRNAWSSGGVEWNVGMRGHNPYACSPLFAEELKDEDGSPVLRMFEYERIRGVAYSITAKLEKDVLLIHPIIENTSDEDVNMYWWSNIAVEETENTRVIVPATKCLMSGYIEGIHAIKQVDIPYTDETDVSYSTRLHQARDFFYKIPENEKKWITAVDEGGYGLVQLSTMELTGRKLFTWGSGTGGKHWNKWLTESMGNYIEIQAGILKTQFEHFPMPKRSTLSWTEGYSSISVDPEIAHGKDYIAAIDIVKNNIKEKQSIVENAGFDIKGKGKLMYMGSGWGAIENMLRTTPVSNIVDFPKDSIDDECKVWLELIEKKTLTAPEPDKPLKSHIKGRVWLDLLERAEDNWFKYYHSGIVRYAEGDTDGAYSDFVKSNELLENVWSLRNIAQIEKNEYGNYDKAIAYMKKAISLKNDYRPLWVNYCESLFAKEMYKEWIEVFEKEVPEILRENERLRMLYAFALSKSERFEEAIDILLDNFILPDVKEGEYSISHIWVAAHRRKMENAGYLNPTEEQVFEKYPLPESLDFRMH